MGAWLKAIGGGYGQTPENWEVEWRDLLDIACFPRRPSVRVGDYLVYYASGLGRICGIVKVNSPPLEGRFPNSWTEENKKRWPWSVGVELRLAIPANDRAPRLADVGVSNLSVRRQSHIALSPEQFSKAATALANESLLSFARDVGIDMSPV
jgi:hypothetical protein